MLVFDREHAKRTHVHDAQVSTVNKVFSPKYFISEHKIAEFETWRIKIVIVIFILFVPLGSNS